MKPHQNRELTMTNKAVSFLEKLLKSISRGRLRVVHFSFGRTSVEGQYGLTLYWMENE